MNQDLTTLKAQAYDLIATIEEATRQLNAVNAAISQLVNPQPEPIKERSVTLDAMDIVNALGPNGMAELETQGEEK